jgi:hypothetical protein
VLLDARIAGQVHQYDRGNARNAAERSSPQKPRRWIDELTTRHLVIAGAAVAVVLVVITAVIVGPSPSNTSGGNTVAYVWTGTNDLRGRVNERYLASCVNAAVSSNLATQTNNADASACVDRRARADFARELPALRDQAIASVCVDRAAKRVRLTWTDYDVNTITDTFACP